MAERTLEEVKADLSKAMELDPEVKLQAEINELTRKREDLTERCNRESNKEGNLRKLIKEVQSLTETPRYQSEIR